jgi:hypothetical protein
MMNRTAGRQGAMLAAATLLTTLLASPTLATEGGSGAYLLGTRDSLSGIVPPPGTYLSVDVGGISGAAPFIAIGGVVAVNPSIDVAVMKVNFTHSFADKVLGGRLAVTVTQPIVTGDFKFDGTFGGGQGISVKDSNTGLGDTTITPGLGFDDGNSHWAIQTSIFLPTGYWEPARINPQMRTIDVLSFGKNRFAVQPVVNYTYFNMENGREVSTSASILFSARNTATDYQTAPEFNLEVAALQHLKSGLAFGPAGYFYQQLANDSGSGAEALQAAYGAESLKARVFGAGPLVTYSTKIGSNNLSFKAKYTWEFGAKRRVESNVAQATVGFAF